jgi:hypothetical protein
MDNKGQLGITIIISIFIFIVFIGVTNLLMPELTQFRIDMNCANPSEISSGVKIACLVGDTTIIYFIGIVLAVSVGGIIAKFTI